jgi:hypothetical protein
VVFEGLAMSTRVVVVGELPSQSRSTVRMVVANPLKYREDL